MTNENEIRWEAQRKMFQDTRMGKYDEIFDALIYHDTGCVDLSLGQISDLYRQFTDEFTIPVFNDGWLVCDSDGRLVEFCPSDSAAKQLANAINNTFNK